MQFSRKRKVGKFSADKNINARTFSDNKISNSIYFKLTILHFLGDYEIGMWWWCASTDHLARFSVLLMKMKSKERALFRLKWQNNLLSNSMVGCPAISIAWGNINLVVWFQFDFFCLSCNCNWCPSAQKHFQFLKFKNEFFKKWVLW